jgi:hypothetical protein
MYLVPVVVPLIVVELPVKVVRPPVEDDVLLTVTFPVAADALEFPAVSLNEPEATVTTAVPPAER